ncbi:acylneuraminate cytidylyltransferase family protein [Acinetobacter baumannii]|uniref:acylneuraminate cytidylyltransferase family protein n=1 Tax=Acinetobacter baumannii TaxID=470 RepID=UPI0012F9EC6E|nr:acylneuraminate cytidylyltransferase family protein [Acinetobacter baumannii]MBP4715307.1 acylneuraminate cytidylyltransferase family protein [Acinetobacter baumannii]MBP4723023.1 acylneuraminate cytidylyltransferase family protein [Acinetobacter baumannii]MBP4733893.1 acylneuraminate cytidylyltransferase family protein [Acinetobacter baumannii]MBP4741279.1 acylneuraminate cytidylyltransferase family protein [Acinetobacter baumannii]MBP4752365.1 acylneuraminate cytidylyltransferase family p
MIGQYRVTALIPARGGSKRLPRKNVKLLVNKPLIAWSIEVAKASKYIDHVVVSTDDEEIKQVSEQYGAEVPFLRPEYLSNDHASSFDVIKHAIDFLHLGQKNELIVLLQPTSPLRLVSELDTALEFFIAKNAKGIVSISETEHSPMWSNTLPENGCMSDFIRPEVQGKRSQDLPKFFRLNGSIYIYETLCLLEQSKIFFNENVYGFETSLKTAIDIDTDLDFLIAETIMKNRAIE